MRTLTKGDAKELLGGRSLDAFVAQLSSQLQLVGGTYLAPTDSGTQIALAKLLAHFLVRDSTVCLYVTGWGIATEHLDLFTGYRCSLGEKRPLIEAPVHVFEPVDEQAFISLLCLVFFFSWDASVFDTSGQLLLQTSHDGWLEIRTSNEALSKHIALELKNYPVSLLAR